MCTRVCVHCSACRSGLVETSQTSTVVIYNGSPDFIRAYRQDEEDCSCSFSRVLRPSKPASQLAVSRCCALLCANSRPRVPEVICGSGGCGQGRMMDGWGRWGRECMGDRPCRARFSTAALSYALAPPAPCTSVTAAPVGPLFACAHNGIPRQHPLSHNPT